MAERLFREQIALLEDSSRAARLAPHFQDWSGKTPDPNTVRALVQVARRVGANPAHLLAVVQHESAFNPRAQFGDIQGRRPFDPRRAQGLLQFMPATAKGLGATPQEIRAMTGVQQAHLVEKYLLARARERLDGGDLDTLGKVALATFYPAYMAQDEDALFPAHVEEANPGIRTPADYVALVTSDLPMSQLERIGEGVTGVIEATPTPPPPPTGTLPEILALLQHKINITAKQKGKLETQANSIRVILREFNAAGVPLPITMAALTNAYAESKLDPLALFGYSTWSFGSPAEAIAAPLKAYSPTTPPEDSRGLFMLNAKGAGRGMTAAQRHDPVQNTRRILEEYKGSWGDGGKGTRVDRGDGGLRAAHARGATIQHLAYLWARDIERPAAAELKEGGPRLTRQGEFLGPFATLTQLGEYVRQAAKVVGEKVRSPGGKLGLGAAGVLLFGAALLFWARGRRK